MKSNKKAETKPDFGRVIWKLMARVGIRNAKQLTEAINQTAGEKVISETSVGKWLAGRSTPKGTSLIFLARALNVSADLILFDGDSPGEREESFREIITEIVEAEVKRLLTEKKSDLEAELAHFQKSKKIPPEDKQIIIAQVRRLLKRYEDLDLDRFHSENEPSDD